MSLKIFIKCFISRYTTLNLLISEYIFNFNKEKLNRTELKLLKNHILNLKYERFTDNTLKSVKIPTVKTKEETLNKLIEDKISICRYGDAEFNLLQGGSVPFQLYDPKLTERLRKIIKTKETNILVGLPEVFGSLNNYKEGTTNIGADFWREYLIFHRDLIYDFLDFEKTYYSTFLTRPYMDYKNNNDNANANFEKYFNNLKLLWKNKDIVFVEGKKSRLGVGNDLFVCAKSVERILCPEKNAFFKYDAILEEILKQNKDKLIILALGPTATVLAYDLAKKGYQAVDAGHIDIEYEWFLAKAETKIKIENKYVHEASEGENVSDSIQDKKYNDEIIKIID